MKKELSRRSGARIAAELMKLTAPELKKLGVIDGIVREPEGGAQTDPSRTLWNLDRALTACLEPLLKESAASLTERRYQKFRALGRGKETVSPRLGSSILAAFFSSLVLLPSTSR